jgi:hypothetical protein
LFLKANVDVVDSLHSCRLGGQLRWNGINEILRDRHPGTLIRLHHETSTGFLPLREAGGQPPLEVAERAHLLGSFSAASQYSTAIYRTEVDAIVMSIQPELQVAVHRHRSDGYLMHAADAAAWPTQDQDWLRRYFTPGEPPDAAASVAAFEALFERIRHHTDAPILVYNMSPIIPGERIHCFQGFEDIFSTQIRRFNLGLLELSEKLGISVVDVEGVLARAGADRLKLDAVHLTPEGYRMVAEEVVRVLEDLALL